MGASLLCADWGTDDRHFRDAWAGSGSLLLRRAGSEIDPLGTRGAHGFRCFREALRDACNGRDTCVTIMTIAHVVQFTTLFSLLMGGLGVVVAVLNHREQVKTQIFLAMSAQYDELLKNSSAEFWLSVPPGTELPARTDNLSISMLRFCTLVSLTYLLFREHRIPKRMWELMLRSAERRFRSPLFMREWEHLRTEFESFPEFVSLVISVHRMPTHIETLGA